MRAIVPAFATWCEQVRKAIRQAQATQGILLKWAHRGIARAWDAVSCLEKFSFSCLCVCIFAAMDSWHEYPQSKSYKSGLSA